MAQEARLRHFRLFQNRFTGGWSLQVQDAAGSQTSTFTDFPTEIDARAALERDYILRYNDSKYPFHFEGTVISPVDPDAPAPGQEAARQALTVALERLQKIESSARRAQIEIENALGLLDALRP